MAWIKIVHQENAGWELTKVYEQIKSNRGKLSNIMKIHSLNPKAMQAHMDLYLSIMFHRSRLKREDREMIAIVVSKANGCEYCVNHHAEALRFYWKDKNLVKKFINDFQKCGLPPSTVEALSYAEKLTLYPQQVKEKDVAELKKAGYRDEDVLDINLIVSYFNFVNRIANGLGVEFSEEEMSGYKY